MTLVSVVLADVVPLLAWDAVVGRVPWDLAFCGILLLVVPPLSLVVGTWRLRTSPARLGAFFFGVEAPLYMLLVARFLALRELTPGVAHVLVLIAAGLAAFTRDVFRPAPPSTPTGHAARVSAHALLVLVGTWLGGLLLLLWVPPAVELLLDLLEGLLRFDLLTRLFSSVGAFFLGLLAISVALVTAGLLTVVSFFMVGGHARAWWLAVRDADGHHPRGAMVLLSLLLVVSQLALSARLQVQPHERFGGLEGLATRTWTALELEAEEDALRQALVETYLAPYRYASDEKTAEELVRHERFRGSPEVVKDAASWLLVTLASPLLYRGNRAADPARAEALYETFMDAPIQKAERERVLHAMEATHDRREREASLVSVDQRRVRLVSQDVRTQPDGAVATVTVTDTWQNQGHAPLEILLHLALPEAAVITGLWMGEDLDRMDAFQVATRGAAQKVYRREVQRGVDPALLEQVGPRQYRLRAFPIPPRRPGEMAEAPPMHVRLAYVTPSTPAGWPLPVLLEKRNAYSDPSTKRTCNGVACDVVEDGGWTPRDIGAARGADVPRARWAPGNGSTIELLPAPTEVPPLARQRVAVVVDTSRSMRAQRAGLEETLAFAEELARTHDVVVQHGVNAVIGKRAASMTVAAARAPGALVQVGHATADSLLQGHVALGEGPWDAVFIITDAGAFDLVTQEGRARLPSGVLSVVHLGGVPPPAYDDATLQSVQRTGGSAFSSLRDAWHAYALLRAQHIRVLDGWAFREAPATEGMANATGPLAALMARQWVAMRTAQGAVEDLAQLQAVHEVARTVGMVTPYSSMIVLVNLRQKEELERAEKEDDRFQREVEQGKEATSTPSNVLATASPEPHEWMMLLVGIGLIMVALRR